MKKGLVLLSRNPKKDDQAVNHERPGNTDERPGDAFHPWHPRPPHTQCFVATVRSKPSLKMNVSRSAKLLRFKIATLRRLPRTCHISARRFLAPFTALTTGPAMKTGVLLKLEFFG